MRVAILLPPGPVPERPDLEDTFNQANEVTECLALLGHQAVRAEYAEHAKRTIANLREANPEVVFNLVETVPEGPEYVYRATALLDQLGLRYTGARTAELATLADKREMKCRLAALELPVVPDLDTAPSDCSFIVKSAFEHGSLGLEAENVVQGADAARQLIGLRTETFGGEWFAEAYIEGREFDVSLLATPDPGRPMVLPVAEIRSAHQQRGQPWVFGYNSKWDDDGFEAAGISRVFPAREPLIEQVEQLALAGWNRLGLSGFAHVDFRVDRQGQPFILEVNPNPCLAREAGFCEAAGKIGFTQADVVAALLEVA